MNTKINPATANLDTISAELRKTNKRIQHDYAYICELFYDAKELCEEQDIRFENWVDDYTDYAIAQANNFVRIYATFGDTSIEHIKNGIQIRALQALTNPKLKANERNKIIKQYQRKRIPPPTVKEVKAQIKEITGGSSTPKKPVETIAPPVETRIAEAIKQPCISAEYVFQLRDSAHVDDIKSVAKTLKQRFHPDKPKGSTEAFNLICQLEERFLTKQKGKIQL